MWAAQGWEWESQKTSKNKTRDSSALLKVLSVVLFSFLQWLSHGIQMTAHIIEAVWVSIQKHLHGLLILNHPHCSFFLLKFYIQVYYSLSVWEHLTDRYQGSSKGVSEYSEIWITALLAGKLMTLSQMDVCRDWNGTPVTQGWQWMPGWPEEPPALEGFGAQHGGGGGNCHFQLLGFIFQHRQIDMWLNRHISELAFQRLLLQNH